MKVMAVVCARNEEHCLEDTLDALVDQTSQVFIVVVDDGSTDDTLKIAMKFSCAVIVRPTHDSYVGKPLLAKTWNEGMAYARTFDPRYVLVLGADHVLPVDYVETLVSRMDDDRSLMACSGIIEGEGWREGSPRGSGRLYRTSFWRELNGLVYPVYWGWEDYVTFSALHRGYSIKCFPDVQSTIQRPTTHVSSLSRLVIPEMYSLGYSWIYIVLRCLRHRMPLSEFVQGLRLSKGTKKHVFAPFIYVKSLHEMMDRWVVA